MSLKRLNLKVISSFPICLLAPLLLWVSLFLSWQTLSSVNFAYPAIYHVMSLDATVATYGPLNLYKKDFQLTTDEERFRLFGEIVHSINHHGEGLDQISYYSPEGRLIDRLLRPPEVVHLQDVANLLDKLTMFTWIVLLVMLALCLLIKLGVSTRPFNVWRVFSLTLVVCVFCVAALVLFGAEAVFYYLHTVVFPEEHQWFFYYQESLMTTMMKAPDLFAAIGVLLLFLALSYFYLVLRLVRVVLWGKSPGDLS